MVVGNGTETRSQGVRTDRRQWQYDIQRVRLLERMGWKVIRITAADLSDPQRRGEVMRTLHDLVG